MRKIKRTISLLLALLLMLGLCGCERSFWKDPNEIVEEAAETEAPRIPGALKYAWVNPLTLRIEEKTEGFYLAYPVVEGLADEELQAAINERITALGETDIKEGNSCSVEVLFNCNDVLCVGAVESDGTSQGARAKGYLTFDLRHGREMKLADLFAENCAFEAIVNSRVRAALAEQGLIGSYDGIKEGQSYFIDKEGLHIVFPNGKNICIGFDAFKDNWAVADGCSGKYYTDPTLSYGVILSQNDCVWKESEVSDTMERDNLWISEHVKYPSDAPRAMMDGISEIRSRLAPDKDALFAMAKKAKSTSVLWNTDITCSNIGDYSVVHGEFTTNTRTDYWEIEYYDHVYDVAGMELELSDMFEPSFDYMEFLREKYDSLMDTVYAEYEFPEDMSYDILNDVSFRVDYDALYIETRPVLFTKTGEDGTVTKFSSPLVITVNYYELTTSQLAVFGKNN